MVWEVKERNIKDGIGLYSIIESNLAVYG